MAQNGAKMAPVGEVFWAISLGPEAIRNGAFRGGADLRSLERKPLICQALRRGILPVSQPTSGLGSRVSDRLADRGNHASNVRSPDEGPVGHHASKGGRFVSKGGFRIEGRPVFFGREVICGESPFE